MNKITKKERVILTDSAKIEKHSPRGVVTMTDSEGNIIFKVTNMIVENGRKFILKKSFGVTETRTIAKLFLGNDGYTLTTPTSTYNATATVDTKTITSYVTVDSTTTISATILISDITGINGEVSSVGLLLSDDSLFSRAIVEPKSLTSTTTYSVTYTIYF